MQQRSFGTTGLLVAPLALGGNVFGWTADEAASFSVLDAFVDSGFNLVDTADIYSRWVPGHSGGESETLIGKWLRRSGKRDRIVLATKVGMGNGDRGLDPKHIRTSIEASLRRLQTDHVDLYQSHQDDLVTPMEDSLATYAQLIQEGKVRFIGASNFKADRLTLALRTSERLNLPRYQSLQPHYNVYDRAPYEAELEAACRAEGLAVINYYALAQGFLSGKYRSSADLAKSKRGGGVARYLDACGLRILDALDAVAERHGAQPAQVALAWQIARPGVTAPIVSATSAAQWQELARAAELALDGDDLRRIDAASAP